MPDNTSFWPRKYTPKRHIAHLRSNLNQAQGEILPPFLSTRNGRDQIAKLYKTSGQFNASPPSTANNNYASKPSTSNGVAVKNEEYSK